MVVYLKFERLARVFLTKCKDGINICDIYFIGYLNLWRARRQAAYAKYCLLRLGCVICISFVGDPS